MAPSGSSRSWAQSARRLLQRVPSVKGATTAPEVVTLSWPEKSCREIVHVRQSRPGKQNGPIINVSNMYIAMLSTNFGGTSGAFCSPNPKNPPNILNYPQVSHHLMSPVPPAHPRQYMTGNVRGHPQMGAPPRARPARIAGAAIQNKARDLPCGRVPRRCARQCTGWARQQTAAPAAAAGGGIVCR